MSDFSTVVDAPAVAASEVTIAKLGDYHDNRYGDFSITAENVENWQTHLSALPGGKAVIDLDHRSERAPRNSEAAGWINQVELRGEDVVAKTEWTSLGRDAIADKRYLFFSPVYGDWTDDQGGTLEDVLQSGALTNKPFQTKLPTISLASEERLTEALQLLDADEQKTRMLDALAVTRKSGPARADSRRTMSAPTFTLDADTLKGYGIEDEDAQKKILDLVGEAEPDTVKILQAIEAAKPAPEDEPKTLDQLLKDEGKVALDGPQLVQLQQDAKAGREAAKELHESKFSTKFDDAVRKGKASPAQRELMSEMYAVKPAETLKLLDEAPQIFNVIPQGQPIEAEQATPSGIDPASHQLDQAVKARLKQLNKGMGDYIPVLEELQEEAVNGGV